ncbi:MAG: amidophosphoribosyltransferase [Bacteriovoracaceae bacterium]|jgi:amidophosphoribosyltransferase|nr:amidophosphoribosyltransferase [Bacteriovoracaceae bacterium]
MCGILGILGQSNSAASAYRGLFTLQHRGQDAAGIVTWDEQESRFHIKKGLGLVSQIFDENVINSTPGRMSLGHTRYPTSGANQLSNVQPLMCSRPHGLALAFNGNLVNYLDLRRRVRCKGQFLFTENDAEVMLAQISLFMEEEAFAFDFEKKLSHSIKSLMQIAKGGYAGLLQIAGKGIAAFRDPWGIRPLLWGEKTLASGEKEYLFSSESSTLKFLGFKNIKDVSPGEMIYVGLDGTFHSEILVSRNHHFCMFEWVYFSNPDGILENVDIYQARTRLGEALAKTVAPYIKSGELRPDCVVPVPDSGRIAAQSMAEALGLPLREALIKNRYIQRSFIMDGQDKREKAISHKLRPVEGQIKGKNLLLVDDSIVRGSTSKRMVTMLRECGANSVTLVSSCPPITHPCTFGIDFPTKDELIAGDRDNDGITKLIGADKVIYLPLIELYMALGKTNLCTGCLTGKYPLNCDEASEFAEWRNEQKEQKLENNMPIRE